MTSPVLRLVARALLLQRDVEIARELAAHYAAERDLYRQEAHFWRPLLHVETKEETP